MTGNYHSMSLKNPLLLLVTLFISLLILQGCFHASERNLDDGDRAIEGTSTVQTPPPATESRREQKKPPSFEDGQLYLQAVAAGDVSMCTKISDQTLKTKCQSDLAAKKKS